MSVRDEQLSGLWRLSLCGAVLIALLAVSGLTLAETAAQPLTRVSLQLPWKHQFEFAGFYAAIEQGFYRERGLELELRDYQPGLDMRQSVLSGEATFGLTNGQVISWRLQGNPVVLLANYFKKPTLVLLARSGLHRLADLRGARLMAAPDDLRSPLLQAAMRDAGLVAGESLDIVAHTFDASALIRGDVDAMTAFVTNDPFELDSKGVPYQVIELASYLPGLGESYLFTSESVVHQQRELVRAFVEASKAGWSYALAHPQVLVEHIHTRYAPDRSRAALNDEAERTRELMQIELMPIGSIPAARIELAAEALLEAGVAGERRHLHGFLAELEAPDAVVRALALTQAERDWLDEHSEIVIGVSDQWPPAAMREPDGRLSGVLIDYVELLNRRLGIQLQLRLESSWAQVSEQAIRGDIDGLLAVAPVPFWQGRFLLTEPYLSAFTYLYTPQGQLLAGTDLAALYGKRVGMLQGMRQIEQLLAPGAESIEILDFADNAALASALLDGQVDVVLAPGSFDWWYRGQAIRGIHLNGVLEKSRYAVSIAVREDWPELVEILNRGLASVSAQEHESIQNRWVSASRAPMSATSDRQSADRAWLAEHPVIRYTLWKDKPPVEFTDHNGAPSGMSIEYLHRIAATLGVRLEYVPTATWAEALERLRSGDIDLLPSAAITHARRDYLAFTQPYMSLPLALFAPLEAPFYGDLDALQGQRVAVVAGMAIEEWLRRDHPGLELLMVEDTEHGLRAVEQGRAAALIDSLLTTSHAITHAGQSRLRMAGDTPYAFALGMAVRRDLAPLATILDQAMAAISQREHDAIEQRWMQVTSVTRIDYRLLWQVIGGFLLVLALVLYWNRRLMQTQRSLRESQARYQRLVEDIGPQFVIYSRRENGALEYISQSAESVFGLSPASAIGQDFTRCIRWSPESREQILVNARRMLSTGEHLTQELDFQRPDGTPGSVLVTSSPQFGPERADTLIEGIFEDITERKRIERALQLSNTRYNDIARLVPVGLYTIRQHPGERESLDYLSPRAAQMLGLDGRESGPPGIDALFSTAHPDERKALLRYHRCIIAKQEDFFWEGRMQQHSQMCWYRLEAIAEPQPDTGDCLWQGVISDITEQKRAEEALVQARQAAEAANRTKSDFLANMSHEIRTPMNAVLGMMRLCLETELSATQRDYLEQAERAGRNLLALLNDILDLSKVEAGQVHLEQVPFTVSMLLMDLRAVTARQAEEQGLTFEIRSDPEVPEGLCGDPVRLMQVLLNLTTNAIKFTEQGGVRIDVSPDRAARPGGVRLRFAVHDTGIGLSEEQIARLFQPFHQADTSITRRYGGTGLGLSICKRLAKLMDGDITVSSRPGEGSCFTLIVTLELAPAEWQPSIALAPPSDASSAPPDTEVVSDPDAQPLCAIMPVVEELIALAESLDAAAEDYFLTHQDDFAAVLSPDELTTLARQIRQYHLPQAAERLRQLRGQF